MDTTNIMAEFTIWGDKLIPDVISRNLDLKPTKAYVKGQEIEKPWLIGKRTSEELTKAKFSRWSIETDYEPSFDINLQLVKIIDLLKGKKDILIELKKKYDLDFNVGVVIKVEKGETPAICFEKWLIDFVHSIGATIDVDLYVNPWNYNE